MNLRQLSQMMSPSLVFGLLLSSSIPVSAQTFPTFSVDPASPAIKGSLTPDDVLKPGPAVFIQGSQLGLVDNFSGGVFDNLDALSYGRDPIRNPLYFSVDRVAIGLPGSAVNGQSQGGNAAGDVYITLPPFPNGTIDINGETFPKGNNKLVIEEQELGLMPSFFGDDLDALELDSFPTPFIYFSFDKLSATNGFGAGGMADDIFLSVGNGSKRLFAEGDTMGIKDTDDLDALVLWDVFEPGILNPGIDMALFSLSTFSTSTFTFTGNDYIAGIEEFLSPADVLFTDFTGKFKLHASAPQIGLFPDDELDALDTVVPVPEPSTVLGLSLLLGLGALSTQQQKNKQRRGSKTELEG